MDLREMSRMRDRLIEMRYKSIEERTKAQGEIETFTALIRDLEARINAITIPAPVKEAP